MTPEKPEPPVALPSPEVQWIWVRLAYGHAYETKERDVPKLKADGVRLQNDLGNHIADSDREKSGLQDQIETLAKSVETFIEEQETKVVQPLTALQDWRKEILTGWKISLFAASALGGIVGSVIAGVVLWKLTGVH